jgi:putative aldouronate transport system permease protein
MGIALSRMKKNWQLYLIILPSLVYLFIFKYMPMAGVQIAFKNFIITKGIWGSSWIGFKHFTDFFELPIFWRIITNTLKLSIFTMVICSVAPIILALSLNEIRHGIFKRIVQLVTFAPYFISTVVMVSIMLLFLSPQLGFMHFLIQTFGLPEINIMSKPEYFRAIYILSDMWQLTGYVSVIYFAALAGVDPHLYEAAKVDGASRFQRMRHIDIPGILPTAVVLLILNAGQIMNIGFEKVYLLQNNINISTSEIISTYVYKMGLMGATFSFSTAIGLFKSVVNLLLLLIVNAIARKYSENSLW